MGLLDDAKEKLDATGKKISEVAGEAKEKLEDKVEELKADGKVKKAEAERDATYAKHDVKDKLSE